MPVRFALSGVNEVVVRCFLGSFIARTMGAVLQYDVLKLRME